MQKYFTSYLNTSLQLISAFDGTQPLAIYLKKYFSLQKKHGSKDRKWMAHFCYCFFRLGFAVKEVNEKERLLIAIFLCTDKSGDWLSLYDKNWQDHYIENIEERIRFIQTLHPFSVTNIFCYNNWLSGDIDVTSFNKSYLIQPDLFVRLRPGNAETVIEKLTQSNISFHQTNEACLALDNATKIDSVIRLNKEAVIQDYSSQQVSSLFLLLRLPKQPAVWDCCAASGGKSILAYDYFSRIKLTVSDIRTSIIENLKARFREAGIHHYHSFIADIASETFTPKQQYDLIICDAPCSGSGTWSRTPEQLCFFTGQKLFHYTQLQKNITTNAIKAVKPNGYFLYITCSVFIRENEDMIEHILQAGKLALVKAEAIKGYNKKADTLFAALFINP